ncbi:MAG: hypothetical protein M3R13_07450 [Armatimonadota bacterium]|nr:hypothetical protein [Armatimonadota bacterium]
MSQNMDTGPEGPSTPPAQTDTMGLGTTSMGMEPNVAAGCSYIATWITGLIFFFTEKQNKFVRFHAMQAICLGVLVAVLAFVYSFLVAGAVVTATAAPNAAAGGLGIMGVLFMLVMLAFVALWVVFLIQAFGGKWFKIPVIGDLAMKWSGANPPG